MVGTNRAEVAVDAITARGNATVTTSTALKELCGDVVFPGRGKRACAEDRLG